MVKKTIGGVLLMTLLLAAGALAVLVGLGFYLSPQDPLKKVDAIVVVSGGDTKKRTEEGIKLFKAGYAPYLIFSGAAREGISNALVMKHLAEAGGVPTEVILIEEKSRDTLENAALTAPIIREKDFRSIILITSPYHQRRAYLAFREELGEDFLILNHSAIDEGWRKKNWWQNEETLYLTLAELQKILFYGLIKR